jgi:hypothetical protein
MEEKINNLKERIDNISNIIGENELANHKDKNKNKTINDIISNIKSQMLSDNTTTSDAITKSK